MLALKDQPPLGYIPAGSTNDFAVSLQIPKDMERAALNVVNGAPFAVDVGSFCGDRNFVYIAGFGAFTEVAYATSQDRKNLRQPLRVGLLPIQEQWKQYIFLHRQYRNQV